MFVDLTEIVIHKSHPSEKLARVQSRSLPSFSNNFLGLLLNEFGLSVACDGGCQENFPIYLPSNDTSFLPPRDKDNTLGF